MSDATPMSSTRPYLIRAMYDWIVDNRCTPHLLVDAKDPLVRVPRQFVDKGVIVLNVSPTAVKNLVLGLDNITFSARFSGTPHDIDVPVPAVQAIYARENGQGMAFPVPTPATSDETAPTVEPAARGVLRLAHADETVEPPAPAASPRAGWRDEQPPEPPPPPAPPAGPRPTLKRVK